MACTFESELRISLDTFQKACYEAGEELKQIAVDYPEKMAELRIGNEELITFLFGSFEIFEEAVQKMIEDNKMLEEVEEE